MRFAQSLGLVLLVSPGLLANGSFSDTFEGDDGPPDGWVSTKGAPAMIEGHELILATDGTLESWVWIDSSAFEPDYTIEIDLLFEPSGATPEVGRHGGIMFAASEKSDRYLTTMNGYVMDWIDRVDDHGYRFHKWSGGVETPLIPDGTSTTEPDPATTWRITVNGPTLTFEADGETVGTVDDVDYRSGYIGIWGWSNLQRIHVDNVKVTQPIDVKLSVTPLSGEAPLKVTFESAGTTTPAGTITSVDWDFGDGQTGSGARVEHEYATAGIYWPKVTVKNSLGAMAGCTSPSAVFVTCPTNNVSPWKSVDVGRPVFPGGARLDGDCISICAGGKEINRAEDHFHYVYQETTSQVITTQLKEVVAWQEAVPQSRAGLMFRGSLDSNSAFAMMAVQPTAAGVKTIFLSRKTGGGNVATRTVAAAIVNPPNCYLKLERNGTEFIGSSSPDGQTWTEYHRLVLDVAPETMLAGVAVTAADTRETGFFANIGVCGTALGSFDPPPNAPGNLTATPGEGTIGLAWDEPVGGGSFTGYRILQNGAKLADVPATPRSYDDSGVTNGSRYCYKVQAIRGDIAGAESSEACAIPGEVSTAFHRGDSDSNGKLELTDAVRILNYLFKGGTAPLCFDAADADDNGKLELTDGVRILRFLFLGEAPPAAPGPPSQPCGPDPSDADLLGCDNYSSC